jgi:predicted Zn-dependent peptidase
MRIPGAVLALALAAPLGAAPAGKPEGWRIPHEVKKLGNGLTVVVSEDHASPTFGISMVYGVGFRLEPQGRTGFAHLFEHMMFEGTPNAPKGVLQRVIEGGGGVNNGSTRYDYTDYIASAPVSALDAILWMEADRMKSLDFSERNLKNQQEVVKEEIRVNVQNRPYGLFFWTDVAGKAFDKWENGHDGYGSFADLDAAKLPDVESFFRTYYVPNNAVLAIVGDVTPAEVFAKAEKYFGAIPAGKAPPVPDLSEAPNAQERSLDQQDALARVPAVAVGWKLPPRASPDFAAATVLGDLLASGEASRLYQGLVKGRSLLIQINGGVYWPFESPWFVKGPTLLTLFGLYKPTSSGKEVMEGIDAEVARIVREGVPAPDLQRVKTKMRSDFYASLEPFISRADALGIEQLLTGDAGEVNEIPARLDAVTGPDVVRVARTWLTAQNRTWIDRKPAPAAEKK